MTKSTLSQTPKECELKLAFDIHDVGRKGHLESGELGGFLEHLVTHLKVDKLCVDAMAKTFAADPKAVTYEDFCQCWSKQLLVQSSAELDAPAVKLLLLLKELKEQFASDEILVATIDWCIEKLTIGKLYEADLEPASATRPSGQALLRPSTSQLMEILSWLAQFSSPKISTEDIEAYRRATTSHKAKELRRRKSVILDDIIGDIQRHRELIESLKQASFSIFEFLKVFERKKVLPLIAYYIFQEHDVFSVLDENAFEDFICTIYNGYKQDNPYHNDLHAADVLQMCSYMVKSGGLQSSIQLDKQDVAAFLIAAVVHDFKHPGVTNGFMQSTMNDLTLMYNDQSVLENYHISETFMVINMVKGCNILGKMSAEEIKLFRKRVIGCILATDMTRHFEIISSLQNLISTHDIHDGLNADKVINRKTPLSEFETKQFIMGACLHAADIGNPSRAFPVCKEWAQHMLEEFGKQGDIEKKLKLPVSFLCDRSSTSLPGSQIGFISGFAAPTFEKLAQILPPLVFCQHLRSVAVAVAAVNENSVPVPWIRSLCRQRPYLSTLTRKCQCGLKGNRIGFPESITAVRTNKNGERSKKPLLPRLLVLFDAFLLAI